MKKYILWLQALILTIFLCSGQTLGQSTASVLSLEQARELAGAHNRNLQSLYLNLLIAQDKTREARSKALPQLGSSITYTAHQEQPRRSNLNDGESMPVSDQQIYEACVSVNQALFNLSIWAGIKGAGKYQQMKKLRAKRFQETLHYLVSEQYLVILEAKKSMETAQKEVEQAKENLRITQNLYREAMVTNTDVLNSQMLLAQAKNNLNDARYDQILAIESLWLAIGHYKNLRVKEENVL